MNDLAPIAKISLEQPAPDNLSFAEFNVEFLQDYRRHWKDSTYQSSIRLIDKVIMPFFHDYNIRNIIKADVVRWFSSLAATPGKANRSLPILSVMMQLAEDYGYRDGNSNPCRKMTRYKKTLKERYLLPDEIARLGKAFRDYSGNKMPVSVRLIRLLLLTGCRRNELVTLKWEYIRENRLCLPESKTGAKTIPLAPICHDIISMSSKTCPYVFPNAAKTHHINVHELQKGWKAIKEAASIEAVRLHDLRHTFASIAVQRGMHIATVSRLLGHADIATTLRYAHFADSAVADGVRTVSSCLASDLQSNEGVAS